MYSTQMFSLYTDPDREDPFKSSLPAPNTGIKQQQSAAAGESVTVRDYTETGTYLEDVEALRASMAKLKAKIAELDVSFIVTVLIDS